MTDKPKYRVGGNGVRIDGVRFPAGVSDDSRLEKGCALFPGLVERIDGAGKKTPARGKKSTAGGGAATLPQGGDS